MSATTSRPSTPAQSLLSDQVHGLLHALDVLPSSDRDAKRLVGRTVRKLDNGGGLRNEWDDVHRSLNELARKYRVISPADRLAEALELETVKLDSAWSARSPLADRDNEIKMENIPAHVAFLIALSNKVDDNTRLAASNLLRQAEIPSKTDQELYREIMDASDDDAPGDGGSDDDWVEPDWGSHGSDFTSSDAESSAGHSDMHDSDADARPPSRSTSARPQTPSLPTDLVPARRPPPKKWQDPRFYFDQDPINYSAVYGWQYILKMSSISRYFDVCDNDRAGVFLPDRRRYIYETDAVKEVLMCLSGRPGVLFELGKEKCTVMDNVNLLHYSPPAQASLLNQLADIGTNLLLLRNFCHRIYNYEDMPNDVQRDRIRLHATVVAFRGGVVELLREFGLWLADREQELLTALTRKLLPGEEPLVCTLSGFLLELKTYAPTLDLLIEITDSVPAFPTTEPPARVATLLLDLLHRCVSSHHAIGEYQVARDIERILVDAAEPMWVSAGQWLREGIQPSEAKGGELSPEFFVRRGAGSVTQIQSPEYWKDGCKLRCWYEEEGDQRGLVQVPTLFGELALEILAAGKAVGLLKFLGVSQKFDTRDLDEMGDDEAPGAVCDPSKWPSLVKAVDAPDPFHEKYPMDKDRNATSTRSSVHLFGLPPEWTPPPPPPARLPKIGSFRVEPPSRPDPLPPRVDFPSALGAYLSPLLRLLQYKLHRVIVHGCGLLDHLDAIEGLFLQRKGECVGDWSDKIWNKMDRGLPWEDSLVLASTLEDAHETDLERWIDPSRVKFTLQPSTGRKAKTGLAKSRRVKALETLSVGYMVLTPLHLVFTQETIRTRSRIFVFLLQLRRARNLISRLTLIKREEWQSVKDGQETKAFYALRKRLSWVLQVLWDFVMTHVLHVQTTRFRAQLEKVASLDDMIPLHQQHVDRLEELCLLAPRTEKLHHELRKVLEICVLFSDVFTAFTTDAALASVNASLSTTNPNLSTRSFIRPGIKRANTSIRRKTTRRADEEGELEELEAALREEIQGDSGSGDEGGSAGTGVGMGTRANWTYGGGGAGQTTVMSVSFADESFLSRIERMASELGSSVRFLQRGIDTLAKTSHATPPDASAKTLRWTREMGDVRETWEMLAFNLEGYV